MLDGLALPLVCAAKPDSFIQWFACLEEIINHPLLLEEEKFLWLWLATKSANNLSFSCSFNYEQISLAVHKPCRRVHRILTRLRVMGFLFADLPIYYGEPTLEMVQTVYQLKLKLAPIPQIGHDTVKKWVPPTIIQPTSVLLTKKKEINKKKTSFIPLMVVQKLINLIVEYPHFRRNLWRKII